MPKQQSHIHRLRKHRYPSGNAIFFCTLPDCHYKIDAPLALGKVSICNICGNDFIMNEYTLKLVKPHCLDCGKVRVKDLDGKNRYIKRVTSKVLSAIAADANQDLRARLDSAVAVDVEDDI